MKLACDGWGLPLIYYTYLYTTRMMAVTVVGDVTFWFNQLLNESRLGVVLFCSLVRVLMFARVRFVWSKFNRSHNSCLHYECYFCGFFFSDCFYSLEQRFIWLHNFCLYV